MGILLDKLLMTYHYTYTNLSMVVFCLHLHHGTSLFIHSLPSLVFCYYGFRKFWKDDQTPEELPSVGAYVNSTPSMRSF